MQTVTHPVTINVSHQGRVYSYTADRADLMNDGTGSNFDTFCRRMRELLGLKEKQAFELEYRGADGNWWAIGTKEALDSMLKLHPNSPATIPARVRPKSILCSPYLYLAVGAAAVGAYLYLSRDQGSNQPHLPLVQKIASTKPPGHW